MLLWWFYFWTFIFFMCFKIGAMVVSMGKAWFTSWRPISGGEFHGGAANSNRPTGASASATASAPAAVCMHKLRIAARMAVGQSRNAVAMAGWSVEVQGGVLGGDGVAGVLIPRVQCFSSGSEDKSESAGAGALNGTGVWTRLAQTAEEGDVLSKRYNGLYRIFLVDCAHYTEDYVENALTKAVPVISSEDARLCYYDAMGNGESFVAVADEEHTNKYASAMAMLGLYVKISRDDTTF